MRHVMDNAEESVRRVIDRIGSGSFDYTMDSGLPLRVAVSVDRASRSAVVDFTGTGQQSEGNFNSPPAVTRAAVLYVFRSLVADDIPLNDGCLKPLHADHPAGHLPVARRRVPRWSPATPRCRRPPATRCSVRWSRSPARRRR